MIFTFFFWLVNHLPSLTIGKDGLDYLTRYYLFLKDHFFGNIFIHHFHRSDLDMGKNGLGLLHSHPFYGLSFVISGGYVEERRLADDSVIRRVIKPLSFNFIGADDFHRVELLDEVNGAWSIFFTGKRSKKSWQFWDRITKEYIDWKNVVGAIE